MRMRCPFWLRFLSQKNKVSVKISSDDEEAQEDATEAQNPNSGNEINSTDAVDAAASHDTEIRTENDSIVPPTSSSIQTSATPTPMSPWNTATPTPTSPWNTATPTPTSPWNTATNDCNNQSETMFE
ncbi:hypothetical protein ACJJTC_017156 [Scirpophaga incertulas]